jgi:hypothetical protein
MKNKENNLEFEDILNLMLDGALNTQQQQRLEEFLNEDEENRQLYRDFCQLQGRLEGQSGQLSRELLATSVKSQSKSPLSFMMAVAAILILGLGVALLNKMPQKEVFGRGVALAKIEKSIFANFNYGGKDGQALIKGEAVHSGEYFLKNGLVKMAYANGATVIVESPCQYELLNDNSMRLMSGKVSVYSPGDVNYKVYCPGVLVEDLGTEFSVSLIEHESMDVHVFSGIVKVETLDESDTDKALVKAGEAVRVIYSSNQQLTIAEIDHRNDLFIRQLETPDSKYSKEILKMNPVLYYPMDIVDAGVLKDYSIYKNNGTSRRVKDHGNFHRQGKFGPAIQTSGANLASHIFVEDYPKTPNSMITGMAWVYAKSRTRWATIMKNWVDNTKGQFHFGLDEFGYLDIEIMPEDDSFLDSEALQVRKDVSVHGQSIHLREQVKFPLNTWQHVAFVHDSNTLFLYRNGELVTSLKTPKIASPPQTKILSIGTKLKKDLTKSSAWPSHWDGLLDEIAIFNKAMTPKEIKYIYEQVYSEAMLK